MDWRFWVGIMVMFIAMIVYVMSGNLAGRSGLTPMPPTPEPLREWRSSQLNHL